jgi:uncharacterized membrane protein YfcA
MVSVWWVIAAFIGGGCAGVLLMAMMFIAGNEPAQSAGTPNLGEMPRSLD